MNGSAEWNTVIFSVFPWLFYKIFSLVSYLSMNFWWSLGTCSFPLSYKFMNLTFCIDKRYRACGLSVVIGNWRSFIYALCRLGFSSQKSRSQWINGMNSDGLCSHNVIWFVKIPLFICVFIRIWAFGLTISELEIVFVKSRVSPNTLFFRTASTVDALHALFLWIVIIVFLISELLSLCLTDERESKDIAIGIKKGEGRIFFVIEELNLQYFSVQINRPTELIRLFFFERRLH